MENQVQAFKPQVVRSEVISQMESMVVSKFISLPEDFKEGVYFAMEKIASLDDADKVPSVSITKALIDVFSNKLDYRKNHCYFFVQNDKNSPTGKSLRYGWQYQGLIKVAKDTCGVKDVFPVLINENDTFDMFYENGNLVVKNHKPTFDGEITAGYCVVIFEDGSSKSKYYTRKELDTRRDASKAPKGNFWKWEREMFEKTLINATLKRLIETSAETIAEGLYNEPETIDITHREVVEPVVLIQEEPKDEKVKI